MECVLFFMRMNCIFQYYRMTNIYFRQGGLMEQTKTAVQRVAALWEFYEEMKELVYAADADSMELVYMNRRARELYGIENPEEIRGKKCYEILAGSSFPCAARSRSRLQKGFFVEEIRYVPILKKRMSIKDTILEENGRRYFFEIAIDLGAWEQRDRDYEANEAMVNEGLRISLAAHTPDQCIAALLEYLGQSLGSERVYIFEEAGNHTCDNTYEWCASGVEPQKENLQGIPVEVVNMWYERFHRGENVLISNVEHLKDSDVQMYEYLKPQDIRSLAVSPLINEGKIIGFYGVDNPPERFLGNITTLFHILGHFIVALLHRRNHVRRLEELCFEDQLTGIGNRHAVQDYMKRINRQESIAIVYCDVMGLKKANDTLGHLEGDKLLIRASECMKKVFGDYMLFRVGGDEFLALCSGMTEQELEKRIELLKWEMRDKNAPMAIGSVWRVDDSESMNKLLTIADDRMYENKRMLYRTEEFKDIVRKQPGILCR